MIRHDVGGHQHAGLPPFTADLSASSSPVHLLAWCRLADCASESSLSCGSASRNAYEVAHEVAGLLAELIRLLLVRTLEPSTVGPCTAERSAMTAHGRNTCFAAARRRLYLTQGMLADRVSRRLDLDPPLDS